MNKKGLVISYHYFPYLSAEGIVAYKLTKNSQFDLDVCCYHDEKVKKEYNIRIPSNIKIIKMKSNIGNWMYLMIKYYFFVLKQYFSNEYDFIHSRTSPFFGHLPAMTIKRIKKKVIWIASFSDPIAENPYFINWYKGGIFYYILKGYGNYMEQYVFKNADKLIFNNHYQAKFMLKELYQKYEYKVEIIPHSFNREWYPLDINNETDKKIISHIGTLYDYRNAYNLFHAIAKLFSEIPNLFELVEFKFFGNVDNSHYELLKELNLDKNIILSKSVGYLESLKIMRQSDYLLLIDADISKYCSENIFFASKLVDYLGSNRPIIGITQSRGISADILRESGNIIIDNQIDLIYQLLMDIILNNNTWNNITPSIYDSQIISKKFDNIIQAILLEKGE